MSLLDTMLLSGLVATVWLTLFLSADRLVAEARSPGRAARARPRRPFLWLGSARDRPRG